ncbi:hypothetical protein KFK09_024947 [Dendrobium nobile]|uniref:Glycosyltransferase 61 catalytic domain-containing protein n=1 Tax=Dendrobium nobile TaxID=94219 RepID=A0A8T3AFH6_DENNO|nr:hypothetical protein KFK09_024947 [Dendrobium nobile]
MNPNSTSVEQKSPIPKCSSFLFLPIILTPIILLQLQSLNPSLPISFCPSPSFSSHLCNQTTLLSMLRHSITFLPLKDLRFSHNPTAGNTWFMSSLHDSPDSVGEPYYIRLPSTSTNNRLLCISASDPHDGSRNSYALAYPEALPYNSTFLPGFTFVSDTFYDYNNLWHGLAAILPFAQWHAANGCASPERWFLFHWGEVRKGMGMWVRTLAEVSTGGKVRVVEGGEAAGVVCFEEAVVARRNDVGMSNERKEEVYDLMKSRARIYCGLERNGGGNLGEIRMTLLFRVGSRSFKNETAVAGVFERECERVEGCRVRLVRSSNLTFCEQVTLMSETDILISPHGAQMTNMIFMDKSSSVMEFFPKGWLELAGGGQYVFRWLADSAGMRHEGQWRDSEGESCPFDDKDQCFTFYKDGTIGHDEAFFSQWAAQVLQETKVRKLKDASKKKNNRASQQGMHNACH